MFRVSPVIRRITVLALAALAGASASRAHPADDPFFDPTTNVPNTPVIRVDTRAAPDLAPFARRAKSYCEAWFRITTILLNSKGFLPPFRFEFTFKEMDGVAEANGTKVAFGAAHFRAHPDDTGAVYREMVRAIQNYPRPDPVWLTDGVADYVRYYVVGAPAQRPRIPVDSHYSKGGPVVPAFLYWIIRAKDKNFLMAVNAALRDDKFDDGFWEFRTGQNLESLWAEFQSVLKPAPKTEPKLEKPGG